MALMVLAHMGFSLEALFARAVEVKTQAALADGATTAEAAERRRSIMAPGNFIKDPVSAISFGLALMLGTAGLPHILMRFRSEEHTSELQSLMRTSYAVFCLKKKNTRAQIHTPVNNLHTVYTHTKHI